MVPTVEHEFRIHPACAQIIWGRSIDLELALEVIYFDTTHLDDRMTPAITERYIFTAVGIPHFAYSLYMIFNAT